MKKENDKEAVKREYASQASKYDRRWSRYLRATHHETIKRLSLKPSDRLLDVGCGTGSLFETIARVSPLTHRVGADLCFEMLEVARRKLRPPVWLIAALSDQLPFPSESFDVVVSCNSLHHWWRPEKGLSEALRVLKPHGTIVITDWCHDYFLCRLVDFWFRLFNPSYVKAYGVKACERLFRDAGFKEIEVERYKINWFWGLMTAKARKG